MGMLNPGGGSDASDLVRLLALAGCSFEKFVVRICTGIPRFT